MKTLKVQSYIFYPEDMLPISFVKSQKYSKLKEN